MCLSAFIHRVAGELVSKRWWQEERVDPHQVDSVHTEALQSIYRHSLSTGPHSKVINTQSRS
jgi:hypothetical protein